MFRCSVLSRISHREENFMIRSMLALVCVTIASFLAVPGVARSAPILVFQSNGTDSTIFTNLMITGDVHFNTPFANIFGRDTSLAPLPDSQRFANDFRGTAADTKFLGYSATAHALRGIVFGMGDFGNPNFLCRARRYVVDGLPKKRFGAH